ncbi:cytoplasmic dynein 2 heavy chain 1 [Prorops nasuta]|uniref:cytoplasmic dynein 2 heavy chain 1 n=1 Tax=Prorops nasuta TaxID=863751 RepID=UPI0034CE207E
MVLQDRRKNLIVSTAGNFFGLTTSYESNEGDWSEALDKFLDHSSCRTLSARPSDETADSKNRLKLSNDLSIGKNALVFVKVDAKRVTEENFHELVQVTSTGNGDHAFAEAFRRVWLPGLQLSGLSPSLLKKLERELSAVKDIPETLEEEETRWLKKRDNAKKPHEKSRFEEAIQILRNIRIELESSANDKVNGLVSVEEALESVSGYVDDLWKLEGPAYRQDRMKNLLDIIGNETVSIIERILNEKVKVAGTREKEELLSRGAAVSEKWVEVCQRLTGLFWPHQTVHAWKDSVFLPERLTNFAKRLKEIAEIRAQHRQLKKLLTRAESSSLGLDDLTTRLDEIGVRMDDDETEIQWEILKRKLENDVKPAEERVGEILKKLLAKVDKPNALLDEFRRYSELINRETLRKVLRTEREALLSAYDNLIDSYLSGPDTENLMDCSKILQEVQAARMAELGLEELMRIAKTLLVDLPGYQEVFGTLMNALKGAEKKRQDLVESWVTETKDAVTRKELSLSTDSAVVELSGASFMRVNYDPRLSTLIRDARALSSKGVSLPREIGELVERAGLLAGRARALQQVATFHNTIGDRIVPSQRPLMLTSALQLARAVKEQSGVVWSDPHAVDAYTAALRDLINKFARQNSELAAKHVMLRDLVSNLLRDEAHWYLIGNQSGWKEVLQRMRSIVDGVENQYGNTKAWKLHWDRQLLKALTVAYRGSLPTLMKKLPEIRVELVFRDASLQWRPSFEEIRAKLYSSIRRSLSIPINFRGVGDPSDARFADLVSKNTDLFGSIYKEAEVALSSMESLRIKWLNLAAPANIEPSERLKMKSPQDWSRAFKDTKQWAQEVGKLRGSDVRIRCIVIDTATTRNDLELATRRFWERLSSDLRAEASSRLVAILEFLSSASKDLERTPRNVQEVGQAHLAHSRIQQQAFGHIASEMEAVEGLAKVMAAWTSESLDGVKAAHANWQNLTDRLERHKSVVARTLEDAKVNLRHKGVALRDERERWEERWSSREKKDLSLDWIASMRDRWSLLTKETQTLKDDCEMLGLDANEILAIEESDLENMSKLELQLDAEESNWKFHGDFLDELKKQEAEEWMVARRRLHRFHDWLDSWESRIKSVDPQGNSLERTTSRIGELRTAVDWLQLLRSDDLAEEHWTELWSILGLNNRIKGLHDVTLGELLGTTDKIQENVDRVKEIGKRASAESGIRQALIDLESWEGTSSLKFQESKDSKNSVVNLVEEYGGLLARTAELRLLLEGAKAAAGYERFVSRAARCEAALSELEERIKVLSTVQRKWIYLEPIYGGGPAPKDSSRWIKADKDFRYLMGEVYRDPRVSSLRMLPLAALTNLRESLDKCQRSLDEFLEEKRASYPRLYFLSDEDLLELVSGTRRGLESHLPKLYHGVKSVILEGTNLLGVSSSEGETLKFSHPIDLKLCDLPKWLGQLEEAIRDSLKQFLNKCLKDSTPDTSVYPTQILLLSERIQFTDRCSKALKEGRNAMKKLVEYLEAQRGKYRGLEDASDALTAMKARALLLDTVHHLQIARTLLKTLMNGESTYWTWHKQIRCYKTTDGAAVKCAGAEFAYRFEYQGTAMGLVRTPLTEKCFLALTQAMKLGLGGSPTGPAGTGKTECVKALGAILGRLVLVFNCDEGMDAGIMKRILAGLAESGAWGCFDEFNRLEEETLSAVGMLVKPLQEGVRDGAKSIKLAEEEVKLDPHCCLFITMNPASNDYGGRHKLPDSLARLFRPIGMAHPDGSDIATALLECAGFQRALSLGKRLTDVLETSEASLSRQAHYDWGLRALRSVLDALPTQDAVSSEPVRLVIAIRSSMLPKLTGNDSIRFLALLKDTFPDVDLSSYVPKNTRDLRDALNSLAANEGLQDSVVDRCLQLYDQLKNRSGVAIVGPAGCGKTTVRRLLADALGRIGTHVTQYIVYPGAMSKSRLLGRVDARTREWKEGVLSSAVVGAAQVEPTWIILDGDVEPEWAEALNSALDDNRLLTLPNGIGVKLTSGTRFIFETHKLADASPATVSRLGVAHLAPLSFETLLSSRSLTLPEVLKSFMRDQLQRVPLNQFSVPRLMNSVMSHLPDQYSTALSTQALLLSLCGQIEDRTTREDLARSIYQSTDCWCPNPDKPYDVLYNKDIERLEPFTDDAVSVDTDDGPVLLSGPMRRGTAAILPWLKNGTPVVIRGLDGCGKSALVSLALSMLKNSEVGNDASTLIKGSSLHGAQELISRIRRSCVRLDSSTHGRHYMPRGGSKLILALEDAHLAPKDLQELLRELLQEGGFHEEDLEFAKIPITVICTVTGSTKLHPRLESLLAVHYLPYPSIKETTSIIELHSRRALSQMIGSIIDPWISRIAPVMLESFQADKNSDFHWTLKDLVFWASSLQYYPTPEDQSKLSIYLMDAGRKLFYPRLSIKDRGRWESALTSKLPELTRNHCNDVYIYRHGSSLLIPLSHKEWKLDIENVISKLKREGEPVPTRITSYLLDIISALSWTLGRNVGGTILAGRPGSGRRSAVRLVASLSSLRLIESGSGRARAAVRAAVQSAGIDGEDILLLLEEHHIREENGLVNLTSGIVSRGELPGLFSSEELDALVAPLADSARREDFSGSLEQYLYYRLRKSLRVFIIVDLSEVKEHGWLFNSGLSRYCVIIGPGSGSEWWLTEEGLTEASGQISNATNQQESPVSGLKVMLETHLKAPRDEQAPARFLALLDTQRDLVQVWGQQLENKLSNLKAGIDRLKEAGDQVARLEEQANKQRQELEAEKGRATAALEQITATMRGATGQRGEMASLKAETERESAELARRKADIEGELSKVEPLVEQASQAVAGISADALAEVRSLRAPPAPVRDVLEGVLRLMGIKDTSWNSMKTFLAKRGIKDEIRTWDARRSTPVSLEAVAKLIKERPESFEEKTAKRASVAAAPLAAWVLANLQYGQIVQQVAPLEREQRLLAERLSNAEDRLGKLAEGLSSVETRVSQLQEQLAAHSRGAAALQLRMESTEASLATSRSLLGKLDTEHTDWQAQFEELTERRTKLDVEAANAASLLLYQEFHWRKDEWLKPTIDLLITERERLLWRAQGLPADTGSMLGASRILRGSMVPILVDPSGVAVAWLKVNCGPQLETSKPEDPRFLTTLELAVRFGKPLLLEELVGFPTILMPLLRRRALRIGDRVLPVPENFRLYLATRRDNLDFGIPKEARALLVEIKMGLGTGGLTERLVDKVLAKESPELEIQRREALELEERLSGERDEARSRILSRLANAKGQDLLQDSSRESGKEGEGGSLLASLEAAQSKAREIALALEESRRNFQVVSRRTKEHENFAKFAAQLYQAVKALMNLSPLYVFSFEAFTDLYLDVASNAKNDNSENDRRDSMEKRLIALTLHHCTKATYRKHRLPVALHLTLSLNPITEAERNVLFDIGSSNEDDSRVTIPDWIPEERIPSVKILVYSFPRIVEKLKRSWMENTNDLYSDKSLTAFEKVLIVKALRPDYLHTALSRLATEQLGVRDLTAPAYSLKKLAEEEDQRPILLLLSPGTDPTPELEALSSTNRRGPAEAFVQVSLGQGQVAEAERALVTACRTGGWVLLSNLQLALNWLPRLESLLRSSTCTTERNPETRIWLTTEECTGFDPGLAGICSKVAYEPPEGVKRNAKRSLQQLQSRRLLRSRGHFHPGDLLLAWLHATLQERRRFVPEGWLRPYEWNESDLSAAYELVLTRYQENGSDNDKESMDGPDWDWETARGLLDLAVYGGRIQDDFDSRALGAIIRDIWSRQILQGRKKLGEVLGVPNSSSYQEILKVIESMNDDDLPKEYFGLPANAQRAWERVASHIALDYLNRTTFQLSKNNERSNVSSLKIPPDLEEAIGKKCLLLASLEKDLRAGMDSPLDRFFHDEITLIEKLLNLVRIDMESDRVTRDFQTPEEWLSEWSRGPKSVLRFIEAVLSRCEILLETERNVLPRKVDLSYLSRPGAFLAALKHYTARETTVPLENLHLRADWTQEGRSRKVKVENSKMPVVRIAGLLVSGAFIEDGVLKDLEATAAPVVSAPECGICFMGEENDQTAALEKGDASYLSIPVYSNSHRDNLVCSLPISCPIEERDTWLRRGLAFHLRSSF